MKAWGQHFQSCGRPFFGGLMAFVVFFAAGLAAIGGWHFLQTNRPRPPLTEQREQIRRRLENVLAQKVQSAMEQVVGAGNVHTSVNLELDFATVATREEVYDPEGQIIRSYTQSNNFASQVSYEINKITRSRMLNGIVIKKISTTVLVNGIRDGASQLYHPRSPQDLAAFANLVKPIVGFVPERGDVLQIENMPFAAKTFCLSGFYWGELGVLLVLIAFLCYLIKICRRPSVSAGTIAAEPSVNLNAVMDKNPNATAEQIRRWLNAGAAK